MAEKLCAVGGDVTMPHLGIVPDAELDPPAQFEVKAALLAALEQDVELMVHSAATIDFDAALGSIRMNASAASR